MGLQPEMSLMREAKMAPAPGKGGRETSLSVFCYGPLPHCLSFLSCTEFPIPNSSHQFFPEAHFYSQAFTMHFPHTPPPPLSPISSTLNLPASLFT